MSSFSRYSVRYLLRYSNDCLLLDVQSPVHSLSPFSLLLVSRHSDHCLLLVVQITVCFSSFRLSSLRCRSDYGLFLFVHTIVFFLSFRALSVSRCMDHCLLLVVQTIWPQAIGWRKYDTQKIFWFAFGQLSDVYRGQRAEMASLLVPLFNCIREITIYKFVRVFPQKPGTPKKTERRDYLRNNPSPLEPKKKPKANNTSRGAGSSVTSGSLSFTMFLSLTAPPSLDVRHSGF